MFIFTMLLLAKLEPANLMSLTDKWTLGVKTLWANVGTQSGVSIDAYFVSLRLGKTFTLGLEGNGSRSNSKTDSTSSSDNLSGAVGINFSKYFCARSSLSPFVSLIPNFRTSYYYSENTPTTGRISWTEHSDRIYALNFDAGIEYFFTCWGKNLSAKIKTSLVSASRDYSQDDAYYYSDYDGHSTRSSRNAYSDNIYGYFPMQGSLTSYICLHF
jgi:hypothetical protein